jgi:hypothetical protein
MPFPNPGEIPGSSAAFVWIQFTITGPDPAGETLWIALIARRLILVLNRFLPRRLHVGKRGKAGAWA